MWGSFVQTSGTSWPISENQKGLFLIEFNANLEPLAFLATGAGACCAFTEKSLLTNSSGNTVLSEYFSSGDELALGDPPPTAFNSSDDIFVAALGPSLGQTEWVSTIAGKSGERKLGAAMDQSGAVYVTGGSDSDGVFHVGDGVIEVEDGYSSNAYFVKLDADGNYAWAKTVIDSSLDSGRAVAVSDDGQVFWVLDTGTDSLDLGGGELEAVSQLDTVFASFDTDGNHLWSRRMEWRLGMMPEAEADHNGDFVLFGDTTSKADFGGGPLVDDDDVSGVFVGLKLDAAGNQVWSKIVAHYIDPTQASQPTHIFSVAVGADNSIYIGAAVGDQIAFVGDGPMGPPNGAGGIIVKLDADGEHIWSFYLSSWVYSVAVGPNGRVYATTQFSGEELVVGNQVFPNEGEGVNPFNGKPWTNTALIVLTE